MKHIVIRQGGKPKGSAKIIGFGNPRELAVYLLRLGVEWDEALAVAAVLWRGHWVALDESDVLIGERKPWAEHERQEEAAA